jgi:TonB family protein
MSYQALLFCPDEKTARVVTQVLSDLEFSVEPCSEPFAAVKKLMAQHFDAIVVDCENEQNATLLFKSARNSGSNQSALAVAVVEGQSGVAKAFRIGANLVLTKPINVEQSKGTLRVARGLLRKADSYKPPIAASPVAAQPATILKPARPVMRTPGAPKPAFTGFPAQRTPIEPTVSDKTSSAFELQQDPTPRPEPTEAALLESMSDSIESKRSAQPVSPSSPSKEYPWQPVSKPLSEPMASSLKRAAEAAGKTEAYAAKPVSPLASPADSGSLYPAAHGTLSGHGAASAPARAREIQRPGVPTVEPELAPETAKPSSLVLDEIETNPAFGTVSRAAEPGPEPLIFAAMQDDESASGSSKKVFVIAALVLVAIAGAYYYATRHPEVAPASLQKYVQKQAPSAGSQIQAGVPVQAQASIATQSANSSPTIVTPSGTSDHAADSATASWQVDPVGTAAASSHTAGEAKPSAGKSAVSPTANNYDEIATSTPAPAPSNKVLTVAKSAPTEKAQIPTPEVIAPPAPSALGVGSGTEKEIAGIVSGGGAAVPKPAAEGTVKISQGVTQGLLLKRVPPSYPQSAKQMRIQGTVQLQASISKEGNVTNVKTLSGDASLARAAIDAVKQWKYRPYTLNNEPVEIQTTITVNFKLP